MGDSSVSRRRFLQAGAGALLAASSTRGQNSKDRPNIVLILADDMGYGDLHSYGSKIETPNLDDMAAEGVRFGQFYATNNVCSPSRASLLTGRYAPRVGVPNVLGPTDTTGLSLTDKTIAEVLKPVGYRTMCIGKWHLGRPLPYMPTSRGFDHYYGIPYSNDMWPSILVQDTTVVEQPVNLNTVTQRYTQQAVNFISQSKASPFFLFLAHTFPHIPLAASTAFQGKSGMGLYGDVIEELDWSVGQVLQSLKDNGLDENTLVMFTSDNGPWYLGSPGKLRGRKGWTYEGGVREPFIARWPGKIPAGRTNERVVHSIATTMDLMPTIAGLAKAPLPANPLDGLDIWPVLSGQQQDVANRDVFLYFDSWNLQCARMGEWKLHVSRYNNPPFGPDPLVGSWNLPIVPELYNLEKDPDESYDVAAEHPDIVAQIQARIQALLPTFPPDVMNAWTSTMKMQTQGTPAGALPIPTTPQ